jgi:hypothetical protein
MNKSMISVPKKVGIALVAVFLAVAMMFGMVSRANAVGPIPWNNSHTWSCMDAYIAGASTPMEIDVTNYDPNYALVTYDDNCGGYTGCVEYDESWFIAGSYVTSHGNVACSAGVKSTAPRNGGAYPGGSSDVFYLRVG